MPSQETGSDEKDQKQAAKSAAGSAPSAGPVAFDADIEISADKRLPQYDMGPVKAYAARGTGKKTGDYFALICEKPLPPRTRAFPIAASLSNPALARLVGASVVNWTPSGEQSLALIYPDTLGQPLLKAGQKAALDWRQEEVMTAIIPSMVSLLSDFRDRDFVHGSIRPSNMFDGGSASKETVILGDGLCTPPSFTQSALYETIERGMALPAARGLGTKADDLYALGISLAVILRENDPMEGFSEDKIVRQKIELGSYGAVTGKDRFTGAILELLRGLLYDEPSQRWTIEEVQSWLDGQRLSPKQMARKMIAARPIVFNDKKYVRPHLLAMDFEASLPEVARMVESGDLEQWLTRSLDDKPTIGRVEKVMEMMKDLSKSSGYLEKLACYLSVALDPNAPIRYKGLSVLPDGIGTALARAIVLKQDIQPFAELMNLNIILTWLDAQSHSGFDVGSLVGKFDSCRSYLKQTNAGYGIERCVYTICGEAPCLSEKLRPYSVYSPEDLLRAFEHMIAAGDAPASFFDRHIIAFLLAKEGKVISAYLPDLNAAEQHKKVLGALRSMATIQKRSKMESFPHITRHVATFLEPIYMRYHDRQLRENFVAKIDKLKEEGDLAKIAVLFENAEIIKKDYAGYRAAIQEYRELRKEKHMLTGKMEKEHDFGRGTGHQIASLFSSGLAGIIILVLLAMRTLF